MEAVLSYVVGIAQNGATLMARVGTFSDNQQQNVFNVSLDKA